ncbi:HAMP domain-containing histidine kinase [Cryobacterium frigoriphilum]|uniref:histidine kinase n=2 Tax=Cryobacterium frigoriphilum TaxID=1259150 RepID=A0A4R8ZT82_9MICO|nr:HAMP domain-containing histidine kinase [Cryobacterium frigoriphilum]
MLAVVLVGGVTAWLVVVGIGPAVFRSHITGMGGFEADLALHAEEAFRTATMLSLAVALIAALVASVGISLVLSRRIKRSLAPVTAAAGRVAGGDYGSRIPTVSLGTEFNDLSRAFNAMATDLGRIEATRTRILGDLAHEMRTPITTIGAYLEAIADGVQDADPATLTMLGDQVIRLARLSEDISTVTTAEEGRLTMHWQRLSVAEIVTDAVAQAQAQYTSRSVTLTATLTAAANDAFVQGDRDRIGQVFTNLLDNAIRHTLPGGEVELSAAAAATTVTISVCDWGDGIPPDQVSHVFERFYRVDASRDRAHGGSGIGLAIAKSITEAHHGSIRADSPGVGRGATFTIALPLTS